MLILGDRRTTVALEVARQTQDRVSLLENDHARLSGQSDLRFAASQEFEDFLQNRSEEDWIEITGKLIRFV